ncbi:DNA polymerase epsilon subunit 4-like [Sycon ciliatum]|uniref:DNA polymerase epsilon subunit 4-like n=1 Tax=Sycon ciliatum TaxID=27933 RepID=UPI0020AE1CBF|eukprot:scpid97356/ scgid34886/ DNA polymerase epsilon subunit 4; DNA polymerase II subunit 4; DNA polymerase epsilon subunit p12
MSSQQDARAQAAEDEEEDSPMEDEADDGEAGESQGQANAADTLCRARLPLSRIKGLMKSDPDVGITSHEAAFLVCKATEMFIGTLSKLSYTKTHMAKRKTLQKKDVEAVFPDCDEYSFLDGT